MLTFVLFGGSGTRALEMSSVPAPSEPVDLPYPPTVLRPADVLATETAQTTTPEWVVERVDAPKAFDAMRDRSLAVDGAGHPHVAYGQDHLYYAYHDGSIWHIEVVDPAWGVGSHAALALAPTAPYTPYISYHDATNFQLRYAFLTDSEWVTETVDSGSFAGWHTSLVLDATAPYTPQIRSPRGAGLRSAWGSGSEGSSR